jgi:hypothetical protein
MLPFATEIPVANLVGDKVRVLRPPHLNAGHFGVGGGFRMTANRSGCISGYTECFARSGWGPYHNL